MKVRAPDVVFCLCGGRAVFLDCTNDLYLCLPDTLNRSFVGHLVGDEEKSPELVHRLDEAGIEWQRIDFARSLASPVPVADGELLPAAKTHWTVRALAVQLQMRRRISSWRFSEVLSREIARKPSQRASNGQDDLSKLRAAFDRVSLWLGDGDQCLARSLAFRRIALCLGHRPSLVVGVKLDPFGAHSWVQMGDRVVNDALERTRLYQPILVL